MEPIGLGTAIICSSAIFAMVFGIVAIVFKLINSRRDSGSNPGSNSSTEKRFSAVDKKFEGVDKKFDSVRWGDTCDQIVKRIEGTQVMLKEMVENGFKNVSTQLEKIEKKLP